MKKKAYLVLWSPMTRIVVPEGTDDETIAELARNSFRDKLQTEYNENVECIIEDEEVPYNPEIDEQ